MNMTTSHAEITIIGGGQGGLTAALAFAANGLPVTVLNSADYADIDFDAYDGRAFSLTPTSVALMKSLGIWDQLSSKAQPMNDILVTDGRLSDGAAPLFLHFEGADTQTGVLAHMVESRYLMAALLEAARAHPAIKLVSPTRVDQIDRQSEDVTLTLNGGEKHTTELLVAADGGQSPTRTALGFQTTSWAYRQKGIVTTVTHARPHHGVAQEYFLPGGPFAILPLIDDADGRHRASLVWTEKEDIANAIMGLDDTKFTQELGRRFGDYLGDVAPIGPRYSYPLQFMQARDFAGPCTALIGDAAHVIHPLAGMGLNLGLRDAAALAECVGDAVKLGFDVANPTALRRYETWRRADVTAMGVVTDGLNRLFSNDVPPVRLIRDLGLGLVDRIKPVKQLLTKAATGDMGPVPKLMQN